MKNHECRQLLERLQAEGFLQLPAVRKLGRKGPRRVDVSEVCSEPGPIECSAGECEPLELILVKGPAESRRWRAQMQRYHYLGCRVLFGGNLPYWVRHGERELACLLWTSPVWKMRRRDEWIGWSDEQRRRNLQAIVNNGRFLILPWVQVKGLASAILALSAAPNAARWGDPLWAPPPAAGNPGGYGAFSREPAIGRPTGSMWGKRGTKLGRTTLAQCALVAKRYSACLARYYDKIKSGRGGGKAIIAVARKFLGIIYRTLKNNWVFEDFPNFVLAEAA